MLSLPRAQVARAAAVGRRRGPSAKTPMMGYSMRTAGHRLTVWVDCSGDGGGGVAGLQIDLEARPMRVTFPADPTRSPPPPPLFSRRLDAAVETLALQRFRADGRARRTSRPAAGPGQGAYGANPNPEPLPPNPPGQAAAGPGGGGGSLRPRRGPRRAAQRRPRQRLTRRAPHGPMARRLGARPPPTFRAALANQQPAHSARV